MTPDTQNRQLHELFEISLILKGAFAFLETVSGIFIYMISGAFLSRMIIALTQDDLSQDSNDFIAQHLVQFGHSISIGSKHFVGIYLMTHGIIKLLIIIGLMRKYLWCYPLALVTFGLFIVYQLYRYTFTHSIWLLVLTVFDLIIMYLIWREYSQLRKLALSVTIAE
ncbi:MAG: hypothetical protein JWO50_617 [Candidatus Kaiserbacteria bacterium]|nr:hypothetical protein [Candidatus Kaiserbacteria bacterium]